MKSLKKIFAQERKIKFAMTPEQFLKKWLPVAEHVFKDMKLTMKDDLEAVIRTENQSLQNVIDRQAEDLRCFENQGHIDNWGEEIIRKSNQVPVRDSRRKSLWDFAPPVDPELSRSYPLYQLPLSDRPDNKPEDFDFLGGKKRNPRFQELIDRGFAVPIKIDNTPRQALRDILEETDRPDNQLIVDCDYPAETLTTKTYSVSGSINKTVKVPEDKFDSLLEALKKCPDKRVEL